MDSFTQEKINLEISKIDTLVDKSSLLLEKCKFSEPDFFDLNAIGSILHSFYNGLESIFKLIHKANGGKPLTNTMWHSELFYSMFEETKSKRLAILPDDVPRCGSDDACVDQSIRRKQLSVLGIPCSGINSICRNCTEVQGFAVGEQGAYLFSNHRSSLFIGLGCIGHSVLGDNTDICSL